MAKAPKTEGEPSANDKGLQLILAARVREIRRSLKLAQHELAMLIGSKQTFIFLVEAGEANVTLKTLARLAKALHVNPPDLLMHNPLPMLDNTRALKLSVLVQKSIQDIRMTANEFTKNADDLKTIEETLQKVNDLLTRNKED